MFRTLINAIALILLATLSLSAQDSTRAASSVPRLVNYSGKALDPNKPVSGTVGVTFAIYEDQEAGAALWMETQNVAADAKGRIMNFIGSPLDSTRGETSRGGANGAVYCRAKSDSLTIVVESRTGAPF